VFTQQVVVLPVEVEHQHRQYLAIERYPFRKSRLHIIDDRVEHDPLRRETLRQSRTQNRIDSCNSKHLASQCMVAFGSLVVRWRNAGHDVVNREGARSPEVFTHDGVLLFVVVFIRADQDFGQETIANSENRYIDVIDYSARVATFATRIPNTPRATTSSGAAAPMQS